MVSQDPHAKPAGQIAETLQAGEEARQALWEAFEAYTHAVPLESQVLQHAGPERAAAITAAECVDGNIVLRGTGGLILATFPQLWLENLEEAKAELAAEVQRRKDQEREVRKQILALQAELEALSIWW